MSWNNVNVDAMPPRNLEYLVMWQFKGQAGKFQLEINVLTGASDLREWPTGEITVSGPIDDVIENAIEKYAVNQFGRFACFLRKCKSKALAELYVNPKYSKAVRNITLK